MIMPRMLACPQTHKIMKLYSNLVSNPDQRKQIYIKYSRTNSTIIYIFAIKTRKPSLLHRSNIFIANFILLYCFAFSKNRKNMFSFHLGSVKRYYHKNVGSKIFQFHFTMAYKTPKYYLILQNSTKIFLEQQYFKLRYFMRVLLQRR